MVSSDLHQAPKSHKSLLVDFEWISFQFLPERRQTHAFAFYLSISLIHSLAYSSNQDKYYSEPIQPVGSKIKAFIAIVEGFDSPVAGVNPSVKVSKKVGVE